MAKITETVKVLLIINILFFIGSSVKPELTHPLFDLHYFGNPDFKFWQPITSMFMHGNLTHLLFNMIGLWMFGSAMEQIWGQRKFLFFYFSAGLGAVLLNSAVSYFEIQAGMQQMIADGFSQDYIDGLLANGRLIETYDWFYTFYGRMLGASGAVYGILVAFAWYFPNAKLMLIFLPVPVAAKYFVPALLTLDLVFGFTGAATGIAHFAHIGGAVFGFVMAYFWKKTGYNPQRWN
ncbi:MAG: rhomboid family intramembrane serine protease [Gilvibacter sp.]